jgi:GGDEF domain-containing protein
MPVIRDSMAVGMIHRQAVLELMSERYSRSLRGTKSISVLMDTSPVVVDVDAPLEDISRQLTADPNGRLSQHFLITDQGRYVGLGSTSALLRRITEQQVRNARYANPLTLLPGNVPLHERIEELLASGEDFNIAYFDINCLKAYNDHYGYHAGDDVISTLARILLDETHAERDFVAHSGGDNFVAILRSDDWESRCRKVLGAFERSCSSFYPRPDYEAGGIWNLDRTGKPEFFGLLTLAVGAARPDPRYCSSLHEVAALAENALEEARKKNGSALFCSRRHRPTVHPGDKVRARA